MIKKIKNQLTKKEKNKIDINTLTSQQVEEEIKRAESQNKYLKFLRSTIYILIIIIAISALIATLIMPVLEIKGNSMAPHLQNGDIALAIKSNNIKQNDVIAFYYGNKILVKRVIATAGDWVEITKEGDVLINNNQIKNISLNNQEVNLGDIKYPYQVPDSSYFILSDKEDELQDSRLSQIGCIKQEDIIGKILFKIWPLN